MDDVAVRFWLKTRGLALALAVVTLTPAAVEAQDISLRVVDSELSLAVPDATVQLLRAGGESVARGSTDRVGRATLQSPGTATYSVLISASGYQPQRLDGVAVGATDLDLGDIVLVSLGFVLNPIVVTVSRNDEKAIDAPASVYSIDRRDVEREPGTTVADHIRDLPGVDLAYTGLARPVATVRGFQTAFSSDLLVLTDNRWSSIPSLRFNAFDLMPTTDEDIERIEVVLGPGSALYGPNVVQGVMHIVTKSPFDAQGTSGSIGYGERSLFQASGRHAAVIGDRVGFKVSAKYLRGDDWFYEDPVEQDNRAAAIDQGADPATLLIGQRDFLVERWTADARLDWRVDDETTLTLSGGRATIGSGIALVSTNASQVQDWTSSNAQLRLRRDELFAQAYVNWSTAGDTYSLRSGEVTEDRSYLVVGQVQHGATVGDRQRFTYGADYIRTTPRTGGTLHGANEDRDQFFEAGGYLQSETRLSDELELVAAARIDHHSYLDATVFSPRAALVLTPSEGHSLRATYNRAFRMPSTPGLFIDLVSSPTLGGLPFAIRVSGMPIDGYRFSRDCGGAFGGLCMRSPFTPEAFGGPAQPTPIDATAYWDAAVQIIASADAQAGGLLGSMNAPTAAEVGSTLLLLNTGTGSFDPVTGASDIAAPRPPIHNTFEIGYKGLLDGRFLVGVDVYYNRVRDFITEGSIVSPNVFLEAQSLGAYIASEAARLGIPLTSDDIAGLTAAAASVPLGTVTPEGAPGIGSDILFTYQNFGQVDWFGTDIGLAFVVNENVTLSGSYSHVSDNLFANVGGVSDISLNISKNSGAIGVDITDPRLGLSFGARGRFVQGFPFSSGVFGGDVPGYEVFDLRAGYDLAMWPGTNVVLSASNVLNNRHLEIPGAPEIGRLISMRLGFAF